MKIKIFFSFCFLFLHLWLCNTLLAQSSNFINFGVEDGLIQSHVQSLAQDNNGNLWIGTIGGLAQYNGVKFTNYTQENGLAEDWISVSFKDKNGNIWFGHFGGGITVYDFSKNKFIDLKSEVFTKYKKITAFSENKNGDVFVGTEGAGIAVYKPFFEQDSISNPEIINAEFGGNVITSLLSENEKLWVGTNSGLFIFDSSSEKIIRNFNSEFPGLAVNYIAKIFGNEIWICTQNSGIIRFKNAGFTTFKKLSNLTATDIKTVFEDKEHIVWIGTKEEGVVQYIPSVFSESSENFIAGEINSFSSKFEMRYYSPNVFFQDRENNIWVGTEIGLHRYTGELFRIYNYNDGLLSNLVWYILPDSKNNFWFSTSDGVSRFTFPSSNGQKQYSNSTVKNYTASDGLPENLVVSMFEDHRGNIWFGTQNSGACVLSREIKKNRGQETEVEVFKKYSVKEGLIDNSIYSICEDKDGNLWFGTHNGASRLNPQTSEIKNFTVTDGLGGNKVYKIFRDSKNNLWFGILGGYLTKYDEISGFKTFNLNQKFILSIAEDKDGNIWFGGYGGGIIKYDGTEFKNFTIENGLSSNSPLFITSDDENNIWIGQSRGIEKYDRQTGRFMLYNRQQGFSGVETNDNAVATDADGNIWFSSIKGVIKFSPKKEKTSNTESLTFLTGLKLFGKEIPIQQNQSFSYNENYLTFSALAVCLTNPKEVLYQFKLEGVDKDWIPPTRTNVISYSNLRSGNYTLMVKASNGEKVWNENPVTYSFSISPPFWETLWFRSSAIFLALSVIFVFIKWRERSLRKEKKILEEKVSERTMELRREKEVVEKQNVKITESISYAKRIQQAILPPIDTVLKIFPESFVFYKPKDIVSGDFYWIREDGNKVLFAAVDCTGHGVPGAFMSIIGHNILEQIAREQKSHEPAAILNLLGKEVGNTLKKSSASVVKDGMDIALCVLDKATNSLQFAGAGNSLYIINPKRNSWPQPSVRFNNDLPGAEIKADKQSIGAQTDNLPFTNYSVQLQKGDMLYIFTDGFPDQKGGPDKKKFYYAPFRKMLCGMYDLPLAEQRKLLKETVSNWIGDGEQYDDMLIFGVKV